VRQRLGDRAEQRHSRVVSGGDAASAEAAQDFVRQRVLEQNVVLEVCPSSNILIRGAGCLESHPLLRFQDEHWRPMVAVCSDNPGLFAVTAQTEIERLAPTWAIAYSLFCSAVRLAPFVQIAVGARRHWAPLWLRQVRRAT